MSCHISLWCFKYSEWRIDLFGVWRRRVSLGKCVNVSMSGRRGGCTVKQERNWTLKWAKSLVRWNRLHQKKTKQTKKKKKKRKRKNNKNNTRPHKSVEQGRLAQKQKTETKQNKHTFLSARHISDSRWQNNTERVRGIKIKPPSVSDCFMNPCRSGGSTPHQTL